MRQTSTKSSVLKYSIGATLLACLCLNSVAAPSPDRTAEPRFGHHNAGKPYSFGQSTVGQRFELRSGDHWPLDALADGGTTQRERSELIGNLIPLGGVMAARFGVSVAKGARTRSAWTVLAQVHQNDFPGQHTYTVPFLFGLEPGDRPFVRATANLDNTFGSFRDVVLWKGQHPIVRDRTYRVAVVLRMDVKNAGDGFVKVWLDGRQIVDYRGAVGLGGSKGYYWKYGIYRHAAIETFVATVKEACFGGPECTNPLVSASW